MTYTLSFVRCAAVAGIVTVVACNMDVVNPTVIDATTFDPTADATTLSMSAQANFHRALGSLIPFSAFFSQEAWVGVVRQETNDIGRRAASAATSDINSSMWTPLQRSLSTNEEAVALLASSPATASGINLARAAMNSGFTLVLLAEHFCQGTIRVGPPLSTDQMLDTAIARFTQARAAATAAGGAEGAKIVNASNVGIARAALQKKDYATAAQAAALVTSATFVYNALAVDDASNRSVGNQTYAYDIGGPSVVTPDPYRALNDPRVAWRDAGRKAQDTQFQWYQQLKYTGYASPIRVASKLEADYIGAEAKLQTGDATAALALIAARRTANGQGAFAGTTPAAILAELMDQRARDFWLEAKHTGDWIRNPSATPYVPAKDTPYYKSAQGNFGNATCLPVPLAEVTANPNFPKS